MNGFKFDISNSNESFSVTLDDKLTVGRTNLADVTINDAGLSRVHAAFERQGALVFLYDENSLNGTFINGEKVPANGVEVRDGDEITLGNETLIRVAAVSNAKSQVSSPLATQKPKTEDPRPKTQIQRPPAILLYSGLGMFVIITVAILAIVGVRLYENSNARNTQPKAKMPQSKDIPLILDDPLKGDPTDDIDELLSSWEVQEDMDANNLDDVKTTSKDESDASLNVTRAFWEQQKAKAFAPRDGATGISPPGLNVPAELRGDGVIKQKQKLAELISVLKYQQPMDFGDLAGKRLSKELIELPMATESFYLEVGSSAGEEEFESFSFETGMAKLGAGSPKFDSLTKLAANFGGQKYDTANGRDRKQMRIRLLRMFHPRALPILKELGDAYRAKFNRPLRVTSLTRSMDYQISLNRTNPNSFKVRGAGSLPPHTSGCAFDLGRKHMNVEEQNFVMAKLAEMENRGVLDALIEYNANACFHTFIYPDGKPPGK